MARSRKEVKKRKIRSSTRALYFIIALVLFAVSSNNILQEITNTDEKKVKKELYHYSNIYNVKYAMNIKENRFIEEDTLGMGQTYVTDLLESMDLDINYQYKGSKQENVKYTYDIVATIGASYTDDGKEYKVWEKKYPLLEEKSGETNGDININEKINVDLSKYNKEVNDFKQTMGMSLDAYLNIQLNVKTNTQIEKQNVDNTYTSDFKVTLGKKITNIDAKENDINTSQVEKENIEQSGIRVVSVIINLALLLISIAIFYYVSTKTRVARNIKNEYKLELNRILKSCQDKIVMVSKKIEVEETNVIDVKDFGELIKLSEELYKPILYWNADDEQEAWFCVISSTVTYRFMLKKY